MRWGPKDDPGSPDRDVSNRERRNCMRNMFTTVLICLTVSGGLLAQTPGLKTVTIRGYVTEFRSPTSFDIEDYRITRGDVFALDLANAGPGITFNVNDIRVGVELEIRGLLNDQTGELKATSIRVDLEQFKPLQQTGFVVRPPEGIQLLDGRWAGDLRADGQVIRVTNATQVLFKPTKREKALARQRPVASERSRAAEELETLTSLDQVTVGMLVTYKGRRDRETGIILAERVEFSTNDLEEGERKLWAGLSTTVADAKGRPAGQLKIRQVGTYTLLPDPDVQAYVASIGRRLIPAYQAELRNDDPRKIPFQFHVVVDKTPNAFATANGVVVLHSGMLNLLDNEAQLAAIVGHEIAHATHEHTWRQGQHRKKTRIGLMIAGALATAYGIDGVENLTTLITSAMQSGYSRDLENQADRLGLQYMYAAGYDPREAPAVWKNMAREFGERPTDYFYSSHDNEVTRRSYLMNELKNNFRDVDYATVQTNAPEYVAMKTSAAAALQGRAIRLTVTTTTPTGAASFPPRATELSSATGGALHQSNTGNRTADPDAPAITNADVIEMVKAGIGDAVIIDMVQRAKSHSLDATPKALIELKQSGVSDGVLAAIVGSSGKRLPPPRVSPPPVASPSPTPPPVGSPTPIDAPRTTRGLLESIPIAPVSGSQYKTGVGVMATIVMYGCFSNHDNSRAVCVVDFDRPLSQSPQPLNVTGARLTAPSGKGRVATGDRATDLTGGVVALDALNAIGLPDKEHVRLYIGVSGWLALAEDHMFELSFSVGGKNAMFRLNAGLLTTVDDTAEATRELFRAAQQ